ncbi:MAG: Gmad2 immunoglobulin-like domain-containing protein [Trueperaceae bacterium]
MGMRPSLAGIRGTVKHLALAAGMATLLLLAPPALGAGDSASGAGDGTNRGGESAQPPATPATPGAPAAAASVDSLTLAGGEVTLELPADLALAATPEQLTTISTIPACSQPFDYCLYLPEDASAGTNLSAAGLRVSHRPELTAEVSCLLAQPGGWQDMQPGVLRLPAASTSRFGDLSEGAAGSYSLGEVRRLWTGTNCYEFESRLVLTRFENYEQGTVTEFTSQQQTALHQELLALVESATLVGEHLVEWPLAKRSSLRAFVRVSRPALDESPNSPMTISGTAVGPWFFEGSFPVQLVTTDGRVLASHFVMAQGEWMTTGFVPFEGQLEFEVTEPTEAVLVLMRDNPSDLPEHDASVRIPLLLMP